MPSIPEQALRSAQERDLDLSVEKTKVPVSAFTFHLLRPPESTVKALKNARKEGLSWPENMPLPILTYHPDEKTFGIMDGMMRIRAAQLAGYEEIPAFVASGDTYNALEDILDQGYYGEDFVELLGMVDLEIKKNQERCNKNRLAGL